MPRTLELLENHGVCAELVGRGVRVEGVDVHAGGRVLARIDTGPLGAGPTASRYPFILTLPQSVTEEVLLRRLHELGGRVERGTTVTSCHPAAAGCRVGLRRAAGPDGPELDETLEVAWVAGCDGVGSTVRAAAGIGFAGRRYAEAFDLADVVLDGPPDADRAGSGSATGARLSLHFSPAGPLFVAPLPGGRHRVIVAEPRGSAEETRAAPSLEDFRRWWDERVSHPGQRRAAVSQPDWLSRFTVQRRLASRFRAGRVLLCGDAAHVHSPVGAQGMNTGIQDAVNLGWKLAEVVHGHAGADLLDTYDAERRRVAADVLRSTDRSTRIATLPDGVPARLRDALLPVLLSRRAIRHRVVVGLAELALRYPSGVVARRRGARGGSPLAGHRAPDLALPDGSRLYDHLAHPGFTLLLLDRPDVVLPDVLPRVAPGGDRARLRVLGIGAVPVGVASLPDPGRAVRSAYRLPRGGMCLIRPDRHVAGTWRRADRLAAALDAALGGPR